MNHTLIVPDELMNKLRDAQQDAECHSRWLGIGVDNAEDMMQKIIDRMNECFEKLNIRSYREENPNTIKTAVQNSGNVSKYLGYLENEDENIDGLFFYNEPRTNNGNDLMTRNIWPALIGIYGNISDAMLDLQINSRPVYIVNLNETSRMSNHAVKVNIICAMALGFHYLDLFDNSIFDVLPNGLGTYDYTMEDGTVVEVAREPQNFFRTLNEYGSIFTDNNYFEVNEDEKEMTVLADRFNSPNPAAELYRFCPKIIPAAYIAKNNNYHINVDQLNEIPGGNVEVLRTYLEKFNN